MSWRDLLLSAASLLALATSTDTASAAQSAINADPICDIAIKGVTLATPDAEMRRIWGAIAPLTDSSAGDPARQIGLQVWFGKQQTQTNKKPGEWTPIQLNRTLGPTGAGSMGRNEQETLYVTQAANAPRDTLWKRLRYATDLEAAAARFCGSGDPRVRCRFEKSIPLSIEVGPPNDGRLPYCTYRIGMRYGLGQLKSTTTTVDLSLGGALQEQLQRFVAPLQLSQLLRLRTVGAHRQQGRPEQRSADAECDHVVAHPCIDRIGHIGGARLRAIGLVEQALAVPVSEDLCRDRSSR